MFLINLIFLYVKHSIKMIFKGHFYCIFAESSSVSGSGRVLHVSAEMNWEREGQSSSTSNLVEHPNLRA